MQTLEVLIREKKSSLIVSVVPAMTVSAAVKTINDAGIGSAVVLEDRKLVGILTERDIMVRVIGQGRDAGRTTVAEVMTSPVDTATPATLIREAMKLMSKRRYRHLPVIDDGVLHAVISMGDVTSWTIREQAEQFDRAIGAVKQMGHSNRRG